MTAGSSVTGRPSASIQVCEARGGKRTPYFQVGQLPCWRHKRAVALERGRPLLPLAHVD
jgi:hypothetical protein